MSEELNPVTDNVARQMAEVIIQEIRDNPAFGSPWMDERQAAAYLGMKQRGMQNHRRKGTGPKAYMPGGQIRYYRPDLDRYMLDAPREQGL